VAGFRGWLRGSRPHPRPTCQRVITCAQGPLASRCGLSPLFAAPGHMVMRRCPGRPRVRTLKAEPCCADTLFGFALCALCRRAFRLQRWFDYPSPQRQAPTLPGASLLQSIGGRARKGQIRADCGQLEPLWTTGRSRSSWRRVCRWPPVELNRGPEAALGVLLAAGYSLYQGFLVMPSPLASS
jgi:hypothetical protein